MSDDNKEKFAVLTESGLLLMFYTEATARASCIKEQRDRFFVRSPLGDFQEEREFSR